MQIELHAIGDAAFDQAARAIKAALDDFPRKDHRHTIIHACLPTSSGLQICAEYGISFAMQSALIDWDNEPNEYLKQILGDRAAKMNPFRKYADLGIVMSLSSDAPCTAPDPILWMYKACNNGEQSLTIQEALKMCTYNVAWTSFDENDRGSLEQGKIADMVILSGNPYDIPTTKINTLKAEQLILAGKRYENRTVAQHGQA